MFTGKQGMCFEVELGPGDLLFAGGLPPKTPRPHPERHTQSRKKYQAPRGEQVAVQNGPLAAKIDADAGLHGAEVREQALNREYVDQGLHGVKCLLHQFFQRYPQHLRALYHIFPSATGGKLLLFELLLDGAHLHVPDAFRGAHHRTSSNQPGQFVGGK